MLRTVAAVYDRPNQTIRTKLILFVSAHVGAVYDRTIRTIRTKLILFVSAHVGPVYDRPLQEFPDRAVIDRYSGNRSRNANGSAGGSGKLNCNRRLHWGH